MKYQRQPTIANGDVTAVVVIPVRQTKLVAAENGHGFRQEPTGETLPVEVTLTIHLDAIAVSLCGSAAKNKSGISRAIGGYVVAKRRKR